MRNKRGMTIYERISEDLEIAESTECAEQKRTLAYMAISAAELAIEFNLISYAEWEELTGKAFAFI